MLRARRLLVGLLLFVVATATARADKADDYIARAMKTYDVPGLSLAVLRSGRVINVDDPIRMHLPDAPPAWNDITLRHLLSHTAGLRRESPAFEPMKVASDAVIVKAVYPLALLFPPGSRHLYSNVGYYVLAEVIRLVSGQPWAEFITARVFTPLKMAATTTTNGLPRPAAMAVGYDGRNNVRRAADWPALRPSGAFRSTVLDLAKWDAALDTTAILGDASRRQMWARTSLADGTSAPYGFGWHVGASNERPTVWHGGGLPGFSAHAVRFVEEKLSIYVLTNAGDVDVASIATNVASLYLPQ